MKQYQVRFLQEAETDLFEIFRYVAFDDSSANAIKLLEKIEESCTRLELFPE